MHFSLSMWENLKTKDNTFVEVPTATAGSAGLEPMSADSRQFFLFHFSDLDPAPKKEH